MIRRILTAATALLILSGCVWLFKRETQRTQHEAGRPSSESAPAPNLGKPSDSPFDDPSLHIPDPNRPQLDDSAGGPDARRQTPSDPVPRAEATPHESAATISLDQPSFIDRSPAEEPQAAGPVPLSGYFELPPPPSG